jgi:hypothetical protein
VIPAVCAQAVRPSAERFDADFLQREEIRLASSDSGDLTLERCPATPVDIHDSNRIST